MLHRERALDHRDDHAALLTGVEVTMRGVRWYEDGFPSFERSVTLPTTMIPSPPSSTRPHQRPDHDGGCFVDLVRSSRCCNGDDRIARSVAAQIRVMKTPRLSLDSSSPYGSLLDLC